MSWDQLPADTGPRIFREGPLFGETYHTPKKTCKSSVATPAPVTPVSNTFEVLSSTPAEMDVLLSTPPLNKPPLVFKKSVPPINIKISDPAAISQLRSVLHPNAVLQYSTNRLRLRASSIEEYKSVLDFINAQKWEFYTYNPVVLDTTKSVLRGLPPSISEQEIQQALTDKGVHVLQVRQLWKSTQSSDGGWSKHPLPIWYVTHSKSSKPLLRDLVGLFNFRVHFEEPRKRQSMPQCFRCLDFGHHANFCKQQLHCRSCAGDHDSRQCPTPQPTRPKCHNCQGDHFASYKECPYRLKLQDTVRRQTPQKKAPLLETFPPLPRDPPASQTADHTSLMDVLRLFSSPEAKEVLHLLSTVLRTCIGNPSILRNLATFLTAFK